MLARWNHAFGEDSRFTLQSYADYASRTQAILGDARTSYDLDAHYELPQWGRHKLIAGGGYQYSSDQLTASPFVSFTNEGENTNLFSGFVQDKITLEPDTWFLTLGSKLEHNDFSGFEAQPNVRLQWQPDQTQTVWSLDRARRAHAEPARARSDNR